MLMFHYVNVGMQNRRNLEYVRMTIFINCFHKKCQSNIYLSDIEYHATLNTIFSIGFWSSREKISRP